MNQNLINNKNLNISILGMLSLKEMRYLIEYARNEYSGQGEIVDLGCWLGSSTIPIAMGLADNPHPQAKDRLIHAYDLFVWESWMDSHVAGTDLEGKFQPGDSFLEACQQQTSPWGKHICYHPGDLTQLGWQGGKIELLFVDAMKSWELTNSIIHDFFPLLIPNRSIVIHQDFNHYYTYWIHLMMYRFRDYFDAIYDVPGAGSLVFKYQRQIPDRELEKSYSIESFSVDEINAAFEYSTSLISPGKSPMMKLAKIRALTALGGDLQQDSVTGTLDDLSEEISRLYNKSNKRWVYWLDRIFTQLRQTLNLKSE
jgi:hypothetical protein